MPQSCTAGLLALTLALSAPAALAQPGDPAAPPPGAPASPPAGSTPAPAADAAEAPPAGAAEMEGMDEAAEAPDGAGETAERPELPPGWGRDADRHMGGDMRRRRAAQEDYEAMRERRQRRMERRMARAAGGETWPGRGRHDRGAAAGFELDLGNGMRLTVRCGGEPLAACVAAAAPLIDRMGEGR